MWKEQQNWLNWMHSPFTISSLFNLITHFFHTASGGNVRGLASDRRAPNFPSGARTRPFAGKCLPGFRLEALVSAPFSLHPKRKCRAHTQPIHGHSSFWHSRRIIIYHATHLAYLCPLKICICLFNLFSLHFDFCHNVLIPRSIQCHVFLPSPTDIFWSKHNQIWGQSCKISEIVHLFELSLIFRLWT